MGEGVNVCVCVGGWLCAGEFGEGCIYAIPCGWGCVARALPGREVPSWGCWGCVGVAVRGGTAASRAGPWEREEGHERWRDAAGCRSRGQEVR